MRKLFVSTALVLALAACNDGKKAADADNGTAAAKDGGTTATANANATNFQVEKVAIGGTGKGRGDYLTVDNEGNRLFVTHTDQVHILDLATLKPIAAVTGLKAAHGVALAAGHGFVTDGNANAVVEFDPATGKQLKSIPAGKKPDSILFDPASGMVMAFNGDSEEVTVIDPAKATVVKTIKLPHGPEFSQTDGKGKVWMNMEGGNQIGEIDTKTMAVTRTMDLTGCDGPAPLSFDAGNRVLFSGCGNKVMTVTDADTGKVLTTVPVGGDPDGIVYDADKKRVYVANRDGGWTIVDQKDKGTYTVNQTLKIDPYAKTVALDPKTHRVFSSTGDLVWPAPTPGKKLLPDVKPGSFRLLVVSEK